MRVDCVDLDGAVEQIEGLLQGDGGLVITVNPEIVMHARRDGAYARLLSSAALALADGVGVVWAARRAGCRDLSRVTGVDLVEALAARAAEAGWRIFLVGAAPGVAERAGTVLEARHHGLRIAGTRAGSPDVAEDAATFRQIEEAKPSLVLVAYGFPAQELWIERMRRRSPHTVGIGVGGTFDYLAGDVRRAPGFLRRLGLEWLFRLLVQPWRARRMAVLPLYVLSVLWERPERPEI